MDKVKKYLPGLTFTAILAGAAMIFEHSSPFANLHLSSLIIAILLGILANNIINIPPVFTEGIRFSFKKVLRLAIILLGFKISFAQIGLVGVKGIFIVLIVTAATIFFTLWLGRKFKLDKDLTLLIAAGSSICGASAVAAIAPVINAKEKDITFAVATITIFGTVAMFLYPLIFHLFHLSGLFYATWAGSSIHEVAQVVAAGFAAGETAGQFATLVKLTRVLLIIPVTIVVGMVQTKEQQQAQGQDTTSKVSIPWFVLGFLAVVIINSLHIVPVAVSKQLVTLDSFLLTVAMAGMGLETSLKMIKNVGMKPLYLGLFTSVFISILGFFVTALFLA